MYKYTITICDKNKGDTRVPADNGDLVEEMIRVKHAF
jgi:hypothetical protein